MTSGFEGHRAVMHLDMDAFFVNVHLLDHPEDAGRPLAVGSPRGRGVVAAASYEARAYGVHSALPSVTAKRRCPNLKFVAHNWPRISACSRDVMRILREYGPVEPMSVDEAYVELTPDTPGEDKPEPQGGTLRERRLAERATDGPVAIARHIRERVAAETQLPASVGLATSKLVAKVASDHDKPQGFTVVPPGAEAEFLGPLSVTALHGVGPVTAGRLADAGIETCAQLAAASPVLLARAVGRQADGLIRMANGVDPRPVIADRGPPKSVSTETTFARDEDSRAALEDAVLRLADDVAAALRRKGVVAETIFVKFRWADFTTFTRQQALVSPTDRSADVRRVALLIWREHWPPKQPVRLLGVGATRLTEVDERQLRLAL